jgi:hypothetical protein
VQLSVFTGSLRSPLGQINSGLIRQVTS